MQQPQRASAQLFGISAKRRRILTTVCQQLPGPVRFAPREDGAPRESARCNFMDRAVRARDYFVMAKPTEYVALLRGINVGGNNIIKMTDLVACFSDLGFGDVRTYIQSGNVLFSAAKEPSSQLVHRIQRGLGERFGYDATVVVRSRKQMSDLVARAPKGFGSSPKTYRYDVLFLMPPLTARSAFSTVPRKEGVDEVFCGTAELYFSRSIKKAAQSQLSRIVGLPIYKSITIRNWNTTTKLLQLMELEER